MEKDKFAIEHIPELSRDHNNRNNEEITSMFSIAQKLDDHMQNDDGYS
jgi:hypothetical protein